MLSRSKIAVFVGLGAAFWLTGLLMIRLLGPTLLVPGSPLLIVSYLAAFPLLFVAVALASALTRTPLNAMLEPTTIMTFAAIFIDGAVIGWLPSAYGDDLTIVRAGAAWLLWGAAAGLAIAWGLGRRR